MRYVNRSKLRWLKDIRPVTVRPNYIKAGGTQRDVEIAESFKEPMPIYGRTIWDIDPAQFWMAMEPSEE